MSDTAEVLILQCALNTLNAVQTDLTRHKAEEASWSVLRAEFTRQAEHTHHLKAGHARVTA